MYKILDNINSPEDVKALQKRDLAVLCDELRQYIIECCATNPGHLGSSLGAVEIAVALHRVFDTPADKIVWDVGHQAYAHKIITGRREEFRNQRRKGGICGFPKMDESPYDAFGVGHASTSISAALGMAVADNLSGRSAHHIAVIGDGALTGGLAFEGINNAGSLRSNLLVILNDNRMSIDAPTGGLHKHLLYITTSAKYNRIKNGIWHKVGDGLRRLGRAVTKGLKRVILRSNTTASEAVSMFESLGFRYFGPTDGNNIDTLIPVLERLRNIDGPKLLHLVTVKGKGYAPAEANPSGWHAPGKFTPDTGEKKPSGGIIDKYQVVFGETITELARADSRIVAITPAMLQGSSLDIMQREMPERVFDVGIAEGHAVTFSAGLAAGGMLPVCNIYSSFMQRAFDNIIHDVALQNLKVVFCLDRGGLVGEDGATHQGVLDMACLRPVPGLAIVAPSNEKELRDMLFSSLSPEWPATVIRYPRGCGNGTEWRKLPFEKIPYGRARLLAEGEKVAILSAGPMADICREAAEIIYNRCGFSPLLYDMRFIKPLDEAAIDHACSCADTILTVEEGVIKGGLFGAVSEYVSERNLKKEIIPIGVPDRFIQHDTAAGQREECGLTARNIAEKILEKFGN